MRHAVLRDAQFFWLGFTEATGLKSGIIYILRITAIIFIVEGMIMLILLRIDSLSPQEAAFADAVLLVLISSPFIFYWVIKPYVSEQIRELEKLKVLAERAKVDAEKANKAKSEFLASMSHDLRTPLNAIMGFSDMMRQKTFGPLGNEHYDDYVEDIHNSGSLLVSLINDVLDLSKIEAGKYELTNELISISSIIDVCTRQLTAMANMSNLTLTIDVPDNLPHMNGDERAIIQVLNNLISNAVKFTSAGGMVVVSAYLNDNQGISIAVRDTGIGMSPDGVVKALNPFEQADGTHSRRHEGTGLGLHLCTNLMKLFGGGLNIESNLGTGTTVTIHFPPERTILPSS